MSSNRRVVYRKAGGPRVVDLVDDAIPEPGDYEVRIRVEAAGVAFSDIVQRNGMHTDQPGFPMTPGYDICGRIDAVGRSAGRRFAKGQRVAGVTMVGGYADYVCVEPDFLVPVEEHLDAAEVVTLCLNYVTACQMLHRLAAVEPGDSVLVHAAGGGVGTALLELGSLYELTMYGTVSKAKAGAVEQLGAIPIDYRAVDFVEAVQRQTDGMGVMAAFDAIGRSHARRSLEALAPNGRLVVYGATGDLPKGKKRLFPQRADVLAPNALPLGEVFGEARSVMAYNIQWLRRARPSWYREDLTALVDHLARGHLQPLIAERFPLEAVREAQATFLRAQKAGKVVLETGYKAAAPAEPVLAQAAE